MGIRTRVCINRIVEKSNALTKSSKRTSPKKRFTLVSCTLHCKKVFNHYLILSEKIKRYRRKTEFYRILHLSEKTVETSGKQGLFSAHNGHYGLKNVYWVLYLLIHLKSIRLIFQSTCESVPHQMKQISKHNLKQD